jgi:MFS family permease
MSPRTGSLAALVFAVFIGMTGFGVFLPIFPFLALELGASPSAATIAMGAYSLGQLLSSPFWGRLSDRVGRKPILIVGLIGSALSYVWIAQADSVVELGMARFFGGLMAGNVGAAFAAAADLSDDRTRARNMGLLGAAVGVGFILGPALGGFVSGDEPTRASFANACYVSAGLAAAAMLAAVFLFRETLDKSTRAAEADQPRRWALLASRPVLARFVLVMFLAIAAQALMETTFGLWADVQFRWGAAEVAWTLTLMGVGAALLQGGVVGAAARIWGERMTLAVGLALFAAGFAGLAAARDVYVMGVALGVLVMGVGLTTPALNALIAAQAEDQERGAVMGLSQAAAALGRVAGPLGAGVLFDFFHHSAPFVAAAIIVLVALSVALSEPVRREASYSR